MFFQYLALLGAIIAEVCGTMLIPSTNQFTKVPNTVLMILLYVLSLWLLTFILKTVPLGIVYATWSALGIFAVAILSYVYLKQALTWQSVLGLILIANGVILVNLYTNQ
jgi:small multidrug resistance pump|tara:strand:+ start:234 stop:560 length:327 start_codon:yes stop_codon:yes gene_type:complete